MKIFNKNLFFLPFALLFLTSCENSTEQSNASNVVISASNANIINDETSLKTKAHQLFKNKKYAEALPLMKNLADKGYSEEQFLTGVLYYSGRAGETNYEKARIYLSMAAQKDNYSAQFLLGELFYSGKGGSKDINRAYELWESAAKGGNTNAQFMLGRKYYLEARTKQDIEKALFWLNKAKEKNDIEAIELIEKIKNQSINSKK